MNSRTKFQQCFYKRVFVLLAASLPAVAAQAQQAETANPSAISAAQLRHLLAGPAWSPADGSLLARTDSARAGQPRYAPPANTPGPAATSRQDSLKTTTPASVGAYRNAVRLDVGGILAGNVANSALGNGGAVLPLLASYERRLSSRFSVVGEGLLNGGSFRERKVGLSVQGRYYFLPKKNTRLAGFYVAPVGAVRSVKLVGTYEPAVRRRFVAVGGLAGWQGSFKPGSRWFLDVSAGLMSWQRAGQDKTQAPVYGPQRTEQKAYYDTHQTDFDGRLGLGVRF